MEADGAAEAGAAGLVPTVLPTGADSAIFGLLYEIRRDIAAQDRKLDAQGARQQAEIEQLREYMLQRDDNSSLGGAPSTPGDRLSASASPLLGKPLRVAVHPQDARALPDTPDTPSLPTTTRPPKSARESEKAIREAAEAAARDSIRAFSSRSLLDTPGPKDYSFPHTKDEGVSLLEQNRQRTLSEAAKALEEQRLRQEQKELELAAREQALHEDTIPKATSSSTASEHKEERTLIKMAEVRRASLGFGILDKLYKQSSFDSIGPQYVTERKAHDIYNEALNALKTASHPDEPILAAVFKALRSRLHHLLLLRQRRNGSNIVFAVKLPLDLTVSKFFFWLHFFITHLLTHPYADLLMGELLQGQHLTDARRLPDNILTNKEMRQQVASGAGGNNWATNMHSADTLQIVALLSLPLSQRKAVMQLIEICSERGSAKYANKSDFTRRTAGGFSYDFLAQTTAGVTDYLSSLLDPLEFMVHTIGLLLPSLEGTPAHGKTEGTPGIFSIIVDHLPVPSFSNLGKELETFIQIKSGATLKERDVALGCEAVMGLLPDMIKFTTELERNLQHVKDQVEAIMGEMTSTKHQSPSSPSKYRGSYVENHLYGKGDAKGDSSTPSRKRDYSQQSLALIGYQDEPSDHDGEPLLTFDADLPYQHAGEQYEAAERDLVIRGVKQPSSLTPFEHIAFHSLISDALPPAQQLQEQQQLFYAQQSSAQQQRPRSGPFVASGGSPIQRKREACFAFMQSGVCPFGDSCRRAHDRGECKEIVEKELVNTLANYAMITNTDTSKVDWRNTPKAILSLVSSNPASPTVTTNSLHSLTSQDSSHYAKAMKAFDISRATFPEYYSSPPPHNGVVEAGMSTLSDSVNNPPAPQLGSPESR